MSLILNWRGISLENSELQARSKNKDKVVKVSLWQSLTRPKKLKKEGKLLVNHGAASAETVLDFPKLWGSQMLTL